MAYFFISRFVYRFDVLSSGQCARCVNNSEWVFSGIFTEKGMFVVDPGSWLSRVIYSVLFSQQRGYIFSARRNSGLISFVFEIQNPVVNHQRPAITNYISFKSCRLEARCDDLKLNYASKVAGFG